ncbi:ACP S-malonyltransferase [Streptomyces sp. NPDC059070]|uniref:ACP S-malonyltransferase n=1 Tax=Streptomyces sp. NPDC059070 TaxID=3346713 RepID=UPI0036BCC2AE
MTGERTAFVFPGQGSQFPGMGRDLRPFGPEGEEVVARAEEVTELPVARLMATADARQLADPEVAQVLVFTWSAAALAHLRARGRHPAYVAGHSLGEFTALYAAGSLGLDTALGLVSCRGRAMRAAARRSQGSMAAVVGLPVDLVRGLCRLASDDTGLVMVANANSARQTVVSGTTGAVRHVIEQAREAGALRARELPVGGAYHSPLMAWALPALAAKLATVPLDTPGVPLVSSTTGLPVDDIDEYRDELLWQMLRPVQWQRTVATLRTLGVGLFIEAGPGRVLTGLGRETARGARHLGVHDALRENADVRAAVAHGSAPPPYTPGAPTPGVPGTAAVKESP